MARSSIEVTIGGVSYPCRMTMGAMLRFKRETGREVSEVRDEDVSDLAILLYCCIKSACNADKRDFGYSLEDFCDAVDAEEMQAMSLAITESVGHGAGPEVGQKKSL